MSTKSPRATSTPPWKGLGGDSSRLDHPHLFVANARGNPGRRSVRAVRLARESWRKRAPGHGHGVVAEGPVVSGATASGRRGRATPRSPRECAGRRALGPLR